MSVLTGIQGLFNSKKGTLCLLVLTSMTALAAFGKIEGIAFSAGCTLISTIYCWTAHKVDIATIASAANSINTNGAAK